MNFKYRYLSALLIGISIHAYCAEDILQAYMDKLSSLKEEPNSVVTIQEGWTTIINENNPLSIWTFTPENHYAHPAFAERRVVLNEDDGFFHIQTSMTCGASRNLCERLLKEYEELDEAMKNDLNNR